MRLEIWPLDWLFLDMEYKTGLLTSVEIFWYFTIFVPINIVLLPRLLKILWWIITYAKTKGMYHFGLLFFLHCWKWELEAQFCSFCFKLNGLIPGALSEVLFNRATHSSKVIWKQSTPRCFSLKQLPHKPRKLIWLI